MTQDLITNDLAAVYETLLQALTGLETAGEFAAAAHVAAAIDVVESKVRRSPSSSDLAPPDDKVGVIVQQLREAFAESAEGVARRQLGAANGAALLSWAAITHRLCA